MVAALRTASYTEPAAVSDVLKYELGTICREVGTVLSGTAAFAIGMVLGKITKGAATSAAKSGGNTGNGTLTMDATTPVKTDAKVGVYTVRFIAAAANNGTFRVEDPDGIVIGDVVMAGGAGAFDNDIKFAVADGSTDFIVGDGFDITVAAGSGKWAPHNPTAVDGRQVAKAVALQPVDASAADVADVVLLVRGPAEVSSLGLVWHSSVDDNTKKAAAIAQLETAGIITRRGA